MSAQHRGLGLWGLGTGLDTYDLTQRKDALKKEKNVTSFTVFTCDGHFISFISLMFPLDLQVSLKDC